jgi:hypothetical protein
LQVLLLLLLQRACIRLQDWQLRQLLQPQQPMVAAAVVLLQQLATAALPLKHLLAVSVVAS